MVGKHAKERIQGKRSFRAKFEVGERVLLRAPRATHMEKPAECHAGGWLGLVGRSEEAIVAKLEKVTTCSAVKEIPQS